MKQGMVVALYIALLFSISVDGLLVRANRLLATQVKSLQHTDGPAIGQRILTLSGTDFNGKSASIKTGTSGRKTLILAFTPSCPYCKKNWPYWSKITSSVRARDTIIWADLSGTSTSSDIAQQGIPVEQDASLRVGTETRDICDLHVTPTTVLLGENGEVEKVWLGLLDDDKLREILHYAS